MSAEGLVLSCLEFKGWVPNTSGALSFSVFGEGNEPSISIHVNKSDRNNRFIIAAQNRWLSDSAIPFMWLKKLIIKTLFHQEGDFHFVCLAKGPGSVPRQDGIMNGHLYIFKKRQWEIRGQGVFLQYADILEAYCQLEHGPINDYFDGHFAASARELATFAYSVVDFEMRRDGVVEIQFSSPYIMPAFGPSQEITSNENILEDTEAYKISSQSFNFLKDIAHCHQHHSPKTDTLVKLHPKDDDISWRSLTLKELNKKVIEFKRRSGNEIYFSALGILPYIKCFKKIIVADNVDESNMPIIHVDYLHESLTAVHQKHLVNKNEQYTLNSLFQNSLFSIAGLFLSIGSILAILPESKRDDVVLNKYLHTASLFILDKPIVSSAIVFALLFTKYFVKAASNSRILLIFLKAYRDIQRILLCLSKEVNAIIQLVLSLIVFSLYLYLFFILT